MNDLHIFRHQVILSFSTIIAVASREDKICEIGELNSKWPNRYQRVDWVKPKNRFDIFKSDKEEVRETKVIGNLKEFQESTEKVLSKSTIGYEKAHDFLKNCDSSFVETALRRTTDNKPKLNKILGRLRLRTTKDWEDLAESNNLELSLHTEESRDKLIECADTCEEKHEDAKESVGWIEGKSKKKGKERKLTQAMFGASFFAIRKLKSKSKRDKFGCYECIKYLPATMLKFVTDKEWGLEQKSNVKDTTPTLKVTTQAKTVKPTTHLPKTTEKPKKNRFILPKEGDNRKNKKEDEQKEIACGYRNRYMINHENGRIGQNLFDPSNPNRFLDSNIVFGNVSHLAEFPWQVSIRLVRKKRNKFICGGTLIDSKTVITSGGCGESMTKSERAKFEVAVGFGSTSFEIKDDAKFGAGFYKVKDVSFSDDKNFAIVKLKEQIVYPDEADTKLTIDRVNNGKISGTFVRPICLSENDSIMLPNNLTPFTMDQQMATEVDYLWFTAYDMHSANKGNNNKLTKAYIGKMSWADCEEKLKRKKKKEEKFKFCAMSLPSEIKKVDTCNIDSGGGLYWAVNPSLHKLRNTEGGMDDENWEAQMEAMNDSDRSFLIGGSTWRPTTCNSTMPSVYSKVKPYLEWIREKSYFPQSEQSFPAAENIKGDFFREKDKFLLMPETAIQKLKKKTNILFEEWNRMRIKRIESETTGLSH